ncbi:MULTISPECIES: MFS transporter [Caulobacter]|jgi:MFS family permease|uniref:Arabinose efflux permease family protein n=1 Tax=Caulobacter vibrioides OR37 TaxID=1292034 RepID=R0EID9_CAUVI|nr:MULTISPECIES: MFS transporter [Caulobacter]ENZ81769.1 arabinose efflux permease family protein [Caulobacter vibrioides OR37]MBQ1560204.1 MFS transporter [Caulobacter sp.]
MTGETQEARDNRGPFAILFGVSVATALGNTGMLSVLPAIGRQIGIPDAMVAAIFSLSAVLWAITSPIWARQSDIRGRKPLILLGLGGFCLSMSLCAIVVSAGLRHVAAPMVIFVLFLLSRAIFGGFGSAANPATQAYMAERTSREERTQTMATLAGATGLGTVVGPLLAPLFVLPIVTLAGPMFAFAVLAAVMLFVVHRGLPETFKPVGGGETPPRRRRALPFLGGGSDVALWKDERLKPFLIFGFLVASCQTAQTQTLGFLIIDKLGLSPIKAQGFITLAMAAGAVAGLLAQWGLIRMFRMGPRELMRWGVGCAAVGNAVVAFAPDYAAVAIGYAIACLGYGFARPGFTAGASLSVGARDQAGAAGAIAAINGLNVVVAPLFVLLYERVGWGPFVLNAAILVGLLAYALRQAMLRAISQTGPETEATIAGLERADEGGV